MNKRQKRTDSAAPYQGDRRRDTLSAANWRLRKQQEKYQQRGGLFPVRFTGSLHDFTLIRLNSQAHDENGREERSAHLPFLPDQLDSLRPIMLYFSPTEVNLWMQRFHDYWLRLLDLLTPSMPCAHFASPSTGAADNLTDPNRLFNQQDRYILIDMLLDIIEKDVYLLPSQQKAQQAALQYVQRCANASNQLLAKTIANRDYQV